MALNSVPFNHSIGFGAGLTATNAMALEGITSSDNLVAVISWTAGGAVVVGQDITDFTVGSGSITAGTIDLSSQTFLAIWTNAPAS